MQVAQPMFHRRSLARMTASIMMTATVLAAATLLAVGPASPALAAAGDAHVISTSSDRIFHAVRSANGSWSEIVDIDRTAAGNIGRPDDLGTEVIAGQLHVLATNGGTLYHTLRSTSGTWTPFRSVENQAGEIGLIIDVAAANVAGSLHVVVRAGGGSTFHTVRAPNGSWTPFADLEDLTNSSPGSVRDVAAAGYANGQLQVAVVTNGGGLFHSLRAANGTWTRFGNVKGQIGNPGSVDRVSGAAVGNGLHLVMSTADGGLFHAVRAANGSWTPFGDVKGQTGNPGIVLDVAATGHASGGQLQIAITTVGSGGFGGSLFHAIRRPDGSWTGFGQIPGLVGGPSFPSITRTAITGE